MTRTARSARLRARSRVVALAACGGKPQVAQLPPPEVGVSAVVERDVTDFFETTGRTQAVDSVEIRARVSGYLVKVNFKDGDEVQPGDVLFEIDPRPYEAEVLRAEGELARWEAALARRPKPTWPQPAPAADRRGEPEGARRRPSPSKGTADAEITSARGTLDKAKLNLEFSRVTAPVKGRVSKANVTVGNLVEASTLLTTVVSIEPMWMYFDIDERTVLQYRAALRRGAPGEPPRRMRASSTIPVEIGLANEERLSRSAALMDFVDNQVNTATGTMLARAFRQRRPHPDAGPLRARAPADRRPDALAAGQRARGRHRPGHQVRARRERPERRRVPAGEARPLSDGPARRSARA